MAVNETISTQQLHDTQQIINTTADFITNLILQIAKKGNYIDNSKKAAKTLLSHLESGKNIENIVVDKADVDLVRNCLEFYHIPYISVCKTTNKLGAEEEIIMIRDTDKRAAEKAMDRFNMEKGIGFEMPADKFADYNRGRDISTLQGIDPLTLELFRRHAKEINLSFSVQSNSDEKEKYDIHVMYRDKDKCDQVLKKTVWELSGENGQKLSFDINAYITAKDVFDDKLRPDKRDEIMYVVDSKNPTNFISVTRDGFATHAITLDKDGSNLVDVHSTVHPAYNRSIMMDLVSSLHKPIILTPDDYKLITGINTKGQATPIERKNFDKELRNLKDILPKRDDYYHNSFDVNTIINNDDILVVRNLNNDQCITIYNDLQTQGLNNACINDHTLAYTIKDKKAVEAILDKQIFTNMDGLKRKEFELYHAGRGQISLVSPINDNQYLVDADNPQVNITITPTGFSLIDKGKVIFENARLSDVNYDEHLLQAINTLTSPIALTNSEMTMAPEDKIPIITSRIPNMQDNKASEFLKKAPEREMQAILNLNFRDGYKTDKTTTPHEQETIDKLLQYKYIDVYVDRTIVDKITDMTIDKKIKSERIHSSQGDDRTTFDR